MSRSPPKINAESNISRALTLNANLSLMILAPSLALLSSKIVVRRRKRRTVSLLVNQSSLLRGTDRSSRSSFPVLSSCATGSPPKKKPRPRLSQNAAERYFFHHRDCEFVERVTSRGTVSHRVGESLVRRRKLLDFRHPVTLRRSTSEPRFTIQTQRKIALLSIDFFGIWQRSETISIKFRWNFRSSLVTSKLGNFW